LKTPHIETSAQIKLMVGMEFKYKKVNTCAVLFRERGHAAYCTWPNNSNGGGRETGNKTQCENSVLLLTPDCHCSYWKDHIQLVSSYKISFWPQTLCDKALLLLLLARN